jgi:hypothetical protein
VKKQKDNTVLVTRVFTDKKIKLFDLYANYVAKRIMFETGMIYQEAEMKNENNRDSLDINDLKW